MKYFILFTIILISQSHAACTVPTFYDGFSGQFFATPTAIYKTSGFIYGLDETTLYVTFNNGSITGFNNVPTQTASNFNYTANPDTFYSTQILPIYHEIYACGIPPLG